MLHVQVLGPVQFPFPPQFPTRVQSKSQQLVPVKPVLHVQTFGPVQVPFVVQLLTEVQENTLQLVPVYPL